MTRGMKAVSIFLLLAIGLVACQSTGPTPVTAADRLYATYGKSLDVAESVYEATMIAAGSAHADKVITDAQLAKIRDLGIQTRQYLLLANAAYQVYIQTQSTSSQNSLVNEMILVQKAIADLTKALQDAGVIK